VLFYVLYPLAASGFATGRFIAACDCKGLWNNSGCLEWGFWGTKKALFFNAI